MSLTSAEPTVTPQDPRKNSPLLAVAKQRRLRQPNDKLGNKKASFLEDRVDELNKRLTDLQSEKKSQLEHNQILNGRLDAIIDAMPGGIILLDSMGKITQYNHQAEQLLAYELNDRLWREVSRLCFKRRHDDGHEISTLGGKRLSVTTRSLGDGDGQIVLLVDQTQTRQLQAQVSHQLRLSALGQMVSALAHQIRTPLTAAMLYASHLCDQPLPEAQRDKFSHKLRSRLTHMEQQVRDMLLFVKGELPLNDQINRQRFVAELKEALEVPISETNARVDWQIKGGDFRLRCNCDALVNAVINLINNALQAYDETPHLTRDKVIQISLVTEGEQLNIAVRDFGPGVSDSLLTKLSQPFVTTKPQGTGLGLAVVRAVLNAHLGELQILQEQPGLTVALSLPCQRHSQ